MANDYKDERKGEAIDIRAWLDEKTTKDGKEVLKNVSPEVHELFANATEEKDTDGRVVRLVGNGVAAYVTDASLKDEKNKVRYLSEFVALEATTLEGAVILMDGRGDVQPAEEGKTRAPGSVCSYFSTAYLQTFRNNATSALRTLIEGPEKKLDKAVDLLMAALNISHDEAYERVYGKKPE